MSEDECADCDGTKHVLNEDGTASRCKTCFPTEHKLDVQDIPVRFETSRLSEVQKDLGNSPEFFKIANTVVIKTINNKALKAIPIFIGDEEHILRLTSAMCNEISAQTGKRCAVVTMAKLQDLFFNNKSKGFYGFASYNYRAVVLQLGTEIATSATVKILKEFLAERRNKGLYSFLTLEVVPAKLTQEGYPLEIQNFLNDSKRFLAVSVRL